MKQQPDDGIVIAFIGLMVFAGLLWLLGRGVRAGPGTTARLLVMASLAVISAPLAMGLVLGIAVFPQIIVLAIIAAVWFGAPQFRLSGWAYGTAAFASVRSLLDAGMLNGRGLPVGQVRPPSTRQAARLIWRVPWHASAAAVRVFFGSLTGKPQMVTLNRGVHTAVFAGSGRGKTTSIILNHLFTCDDSAVVIDIKGEISRQTLEYRERVFGHQCIVLDPFGQTEFPSARLNPLSLIDIESPNSLDDVRALAEAIVVTTGEEREPHWNLSSRMHISAAIALVLSEVTAEQKNLQSVVHFLSGMEELAQLRIALRESKAWGGLLARMGAQLSHYQDRELGSTLTTVATNLEFLSTPALVRSTTATTFDPRELVNGRMTIYLVLPPDLISSQSGLLRLWVNSLLKVVIRSGLKSDRKVQFVLDESAALGNLKAIETAVSLLRSYGARCLFAYQSLAQLEVQFPKQSQTFLSNCDNLIFFGVNDFQTAEMVSKLIGEFSVVHFSHNGGRSRSVNFDPHGMASSSFTSNDGWSAQEGARLLVRPEEILRMSERQAVVFTPESAPILTTLSRSYEVGFWRWLRSRHDTHTLHALLLFLFSLVAVGFLAALALEELKKPRRQPAPVPQWGGQPWQQPQPPAWPGAQHPAFRR